MKNKELIVMLASLDGDAEVRAWDADSKAYEPVTGCIYGGKAKDGSPDMIVLQTDDNG